MRSLAISSLLLVLAVSGQAQDSGATPPKRFGLFADVRRYPQGSPKETLASVLQAIEQKRFDYLIAHLADPDFVDQRVKQAKGNFDEIVREARTKYQENPEIAKQLQRYLKEGEWEGGDTLTASAQLKDAKDKRLYFRKVESRWYFENRQKAKPGS